MSGHKKDVDDVSGVETTGHEWDGIKELDNPLPRWWLVIFYACIAVSIVMWALFPAWPGISAYTTGVLGHSDRAAVTAEVKRLQDARAPSFDQLAAASLNAIEADPALMQFAQAAGKSAFGDNCATCHGVGGAGAKGYPNLNDDVWLWGGAVADIEHTIKVGIRSDNPEARMSLMPAYGRDQLLEPQQIDDVANYVVSISAAKARLKVDAAAAARGAEHYATQCAACHGETGAGDRAQGAPSLNDDVWLYGGSFAEIKAQIFNGRGGVMPSWEARLDPGVVKALAVYVHSLGGGEAEPKAADAVEPAAPAAAPTR